MYTLFTTMPEVLAMAIVFIPLYFILNKVLFYNIRKSTVYCIFSFYLATVYILVGLPNVTYVRFDLTFNIIPFSGFLADIKNCIFNVLLFVPFGIMLPIICPNCKTAKNTFYFGFCMSLIIEVLQIFTYRATDINDLITNGLGSYLGFFPSKLLIQKISSLKDLSRKTSTGEFYRVSIITFFIMFYVHPFISSLIWKFIL